MVVKKDEEFWVTNISRNQDIRAGDLRLTFRHGKSVNLFAKGKNGKFLYNLTKEDIEKSKESGSLFKKRHLLKIRQVAPVILNHRIDVAQYLDKDTSRMKRKASEIEVLEFPDLDFEDDSDDNISVEQFAAENADVDFEDRRPVLVVDPKYKKPTVDDG
jgi:hypothetical protein